MLKFFFEHFEFFTIVQNLFQKHLNLEKFMFFAKKNFNEREKPRKKFTKNWKNAMEFI